MTIPDPGRGGRPATLVVDTLTHLVVAADEAACSVWECDSPAALTGSSVYTLLGIDETILAERLNPRAVQAGQAYYTALETLTGKRIEVLVLFGHGAGATPHRQARAVLTVTPIDWAGGTAGLSEMLLGQIRRQLEEERNNLDLVFRAAPVGMMLVNDDAYVVKANEQMFSLFGRTAAEVYGQGFGNVFGCSAAVRSGAACGTMPGCRACQVRSSVLRVLVDDEAVTGLELGQDFEMGIAEGSHKWLRINVAPLKLAGRRYALVAMDDITHRVQLEQKLEALSYVDELSGLANRRAAIEALLSHLAEVRRANGFFSLIMLDIDDFKMINDRYGHVTGDDVIRQLGHALKASFRQVDLVSRYGGEEFLLLLPGVRAGKVEGLLNRVWARIAAYDFGADGLRLTVSGGVLEVDAAVAGGQDYYQLVDAVDELMYQAKAAGKDRLVVKGLPASG